MKLIFKQRFFSWFDSYDIYDESGRVVYTVKGQLSWGHLLKIFDAEGNEVGIIKERIVTFLPKFEIYMGNDYVGCISKQLTFFKPEYQVDYNGWSMEGDYWEWNYSIVDEGANHIATISKQLMKLTDTYVIDIHRPQHDLEVLMLVLAIDAEKDK